MLELRVSLRKALPQGYIVTKTKRFGFGHLRCGNGPKLVVLIGDVTYDAAALIGRAATVPATVDAGLAGGTDWDALRNAAFEAAGGSGAAAARLTPPARWLPAVLRPGKILALGRSYRAHAIELGNAPLLEPLVFNKLPDCLSGSGDAVRVPADAQGVIDHEAELAVVIGTAVDGAPDGTGARAIAGYTMCNDMTLRHVQAAAKTAGHPWFRAKNFPGSCALGPLFVPAAQVLAADDLQVECHVNGELRQHANSGEMVWRVATAVERLSRLWPLRPGDVISTGTPAGVSSMSAGDVCRVSILGKHCDFGVLETRIVS